MTRLLHTGDTHVGYAQYHSPERREDFLAAFEAVVEDAVDADVDAVVHAGDLFHDRRPDLPDLLGTLAALRRLADADVPFLAVVGNHEATRDGQWLDLFESLGLATRLGETPCVVEDTAVYGLDHVPKSRRDDLDYEFAPNDAEHAVLVAHGLFTPFPHADWETETVLREATVDFDALLLGDNHTPDTAEVLGTWVTYCGSTERTSASEEAGRGYNLVALGDEAGVEGDGRVDIRRRALETRPFVYVTVDLSNGEGVERAREQVRQHDLADAVAVVEIVGEGDPVPPASVEDAALEAGALLARVTDRREVDSDAPIDVSFADPDAVVRDRVDDLDLSRGALAVDDAVRAADVPDSNVRETVKRRVTEHLEGLESGGDAGATEDDAATTDDDVGATDGDASSDKNRDGQTDEREPVAEADGSNDADRAGDSSAGEADDPEESQGEGVTDGQISMEDFR